MITSHCKYKEGQRFGSFTIEDYCQETKKYVVKCDCGTRTFAKGNAMAVGRHLRCKSCAATRKSLTTHLPNNLALKNFVFRNYSRAAKNRGYEFTLTKESFFSLLAGRCYYCGRLPTMSISSLWWGKGKPGSIERVFVYNGVDRVDNNLGYTEDNCVSCCKICNNSKSTLGLEEWKNWIKEVHSNLCSVPPEKISS